MRRLTRFGGRFATLHAQALFLLKMELDFFVQLAFLAPAPQDPWQISFGDLFPAWHMLSLMRPAS
jgi:hypothetical protein